MYTGLVEAIGLVQNVENKKDGSILEIEIFFDHDDVKNGDSININGVCLTVTFIVNKKFSFYCSYKTLELTNLGLLKVGSKVNVERSLTLSSRLGGHLVSGHIDDKAKIVFLEKKNDVYVYKVELINEILKYIVKKGSIAVDGISLTVVHIEDNVVELILIPETINKTNVASTWNVNHFVNIEVDMIARYTEKLILKKEK